MIAFEFYSVELVLIKFEVLKMEELALEADLGEVNKIVAHEKTT